MRPDNVSAVYTSMKVCYPTVGACSVFLAGKMMIQYKQCHVFYLAVLLQRNTIVSDEVHVSYTCTDQKTYFLKDIFLEGPTFKYTCVPAL